MTEDVKIATEDIFISCFKVVIVTSDFNKLHS
jgi:hypothetical protein